MLRFRLGQESSSTYGIFSHRSRCSILCVRHSLVLVAVGESIQWNILDSDNLFDFYSEGILQALPFTCPSRAPHLFFIRSVFALHLFFVWYRHFVFDSGCGVDIWHHSLSTFLRQWFLILDSWFSVLLPLVSIRLLLLIRFEPHRVFLFRMINLTRDLICLLGNSSVGLPIILWCSIPDSNHWATPRLELPSS